jgi:hypothetical protein
MTRFFATLSLIVLALFALGGGQAAAHSSAPLKTLAVRIGAYPLLVHYYNDPRGGQALVFGIEPQAGTTPPSSYHIVAIPGATTNATAVNASVTTAIDHAGIDGTVNLPVSGQWLLEIQVDGPLGPSNGEAPLLASAPPAIPEWVGWLIGFLPVVVLLGFIMVQLRRARAAPPLLAI